jgi:hypothetical protein
VTSWNSTSPMWDDLRFPVSAINPVGLAAPPTLNQDNGLLEFSATLVNTVAIQAQMPHSWQEGSVIVPHVHWRKKTQGTGNVVWKLTYEFVNRGTAFTDTPTPLTASATVGAAEDGTALVHHITSFGDVSMDGKTISCMGLITVSRLGDDPADTYAGVAQLLEFDIHYLIDAFGSIQAFAKQGVELAAHGGYGLTINS